MGTGTGFVQLYAWSRRTLFTLVRSFVQMLRPLVRCQVVFEGKSCIAPILVALEWFFVRVLCLFVPLHALFGFERGIAYGTPESLVPEVVVDGFLLIIGYVLWDLPTARAVLVSAVLKKQPDT